MFEFWKKDNELQQEDIPQKDSEIKEDNDIKEDNEDIEIKTPSLESKTDKKKQKNPHPYGLGFITGVLCTVLIFSVVFVATNSSLILNGVSIFSTDSLLNSQTVNKLNLIESVIDQYYYKADIDSSNEREGLYKGLIESLDDKFSFYYTADEMKSETNDSEGVYYGIGASISVDEDTTLPSIASITEDSPAESVGLQVGDIITAVDGETTKGMSTTDLVSKVKGEEGTSVHLSIKREGEDATLEFDITRAKFDSVTVSHQMLKDKVGYIQINSFDGVTYDQFKEAYDDLNSQEMKALILDLRGNLGGNVTTVCDIAREILPAGDIFYEVDRDGNKTEYTCDGANEIKIPLAVVVNKYSASASEILTGAIKDYGIGIVVGTTTYGKGVVQRTFPFTDGSAVHITIANYFTPSGNDINGVGITPDIEVELDSEKYLADGTDTQLEKAFEALKAQME